MNREKNTIIICLIIGLFMLSGCSGNSSLNLPADNVQKEIVIDKLEIYHFHITRQCYSCITMGDYAEETVKTYFADELKSGKIVFGHINAELPENRGLAMKYGATGSSLWLGVYDKDGFHKEENVNVWYKISNKQDYMNYLKGLIEKRLAGDFS